MYFRQFYLKCLAHASYMIGSEGSAVVVDPQRDVGGYLAEAEAQGLRITHVIETHLHADFVSGHVELSERTGAEIVLSAAADAAFPHHAVRDGDEIRLGDITLRFLETPGHTPESISVLALDQRGQPQMILTGDALFIGDVGRPDLAGGAGFSPEQMASTMYDTIQMKFLSLPDSVAVYPAHGAGSMCGRNISTETSSTIGEQRRMNYALQPMSRQEFVRMMTEDLPESPAYFQYDAQMNRTGARSLEQLPRPKALSPQQVHELSRQGALALDVRPSAVFGAGHVPGALNIGLGGEFASWAGSLIPIGTPIIIVAEDEAGVDEATMRLARVGIESVAGYLDGGMYAWYAGDLPMREIPQINVRDLHERITATNDLPVMDVRRDTEYDDGHIPNALHFSLATLTDHIAELDATAQIAVVCAGGYRSSAASSMLQRAGFTDVINVIGGTDAWRRSGYPVER